MRFDYTCINKLLEQEVDMKIDCMEMFRKDRAVLSYKGERRALVNVFRKLAELHHFEPIFMFVHQMFRYRKGKNMVYLKEILSEVPIVYDSGEQGTLAELVEIYAQTLQENVSARYGFTPKTNIKGIDIFTDCPDELFKRTINQAEIIRYVVGAGLLASVYVAHNLICEEAVDEMVISIRQKAEEAHRREHRQIHDGEGENPGDGEENNRAIPELSVFERDLAIPGMLLPFVKTEEMKEGKQELCFYMLEKYVFPVLEAAPWSEEENEYMPGILQITKEYAKDIRKLQLWPRSISEDVHSSKDMDYVEQGLYYEALGWDRKSEYRYTNSGEVEKACRHSGVYNRWASIIQRGGYRLKQVMAPADYSFHMLDTPMQLYLSGRTEEACQFLLMHYGDLGEYELRKPHLIILLVRCIRNASRLETANALYGLVSYELDRIRWDEYRHRELTFRMLQFLRDARTHIQERNEYAIAEGISWFDILFKKHNIDGVLALCEEELRNHEILNEELFQKLYQIVNAFSYHTGIHLGWLGLPKYDNYDKLDGALSNELLLRAQGCVAEGKNSKVFYARWGQLATLRSIDLHLQLHLSQKQKEGVKEKLALANQLKEKMRNKEMDEAQREAFLKEIEAITEELVATARGARQWRPEVEREIAENRRAFEEKYANVLGENNDLMNKLEENVRKDVQNYLVTSNMVFKMMKTQHEGESRDDKNLDYSAALISMTKALELVMKHIYIKVNGVNEGGRIDKYTGMTKNDWSHYAWWDKKTETYVVKIKNQTLQPCINILMDRPRIKAWKIKKVLDLDLLKKFEEIRDLDVETLDTYKGNEIENYRDQKDDPWMHPVSKLRLALGHVCQKYRNGSAHTGVITLVNVEECQKMLITGQNLLWIVLAIMKSPESVC